MFDIKEANFKKSILQKKAAEASEKNNLILNWSTGVGKTRAALKILNIHDTQIEKFFICVNEISHIKGWEDEIIKSGYEEILRKCEIFCYASLHKYVKKILKGQYNGPYFFIFDEYHHVSEAKFQLLKQVPIYKFTALSATGTVETDYRIDNLSSLTSFPLAVDRITPSMAIKEGLLPEPEVFVIKQKLDKKEKRVEVYVKKKGKTTKDTKVYNIDFPERWDWFKKLKVEGSYVLNIACNKYEKYKLICDDIEYSKKTYYKLLFQSKKANKPEPEWARLKFLRAAGARKQFIAYCKTELAKQIIKQKLEGQRFICFTGSIDQCKDLGQDGNIIHSKLSTKECEKILFDFNSYEIDRIFCVIKLREGQNLAGIDAGLVIQLDNQEKSFVQELGRVLRSSYPKFYITVLEGTRDEDFFNKALAGFNKDYIKYIDIK